MSYKWDTSKNSPNFTPKAKVQATFGRPRTIEKIAIHHWGAKTATYEGTIATLISPSSGVSAHFVATGTGRRVACLVDFENASWATNSANPYTLSIECDPRARAEDYDVVAELIAQIRSIYGNLPLVPHKQFVATACPGDYNLAKLDALAKTKVATKADPWGTVRNKPVVTTKDETKNETILFKKVTKEDASLPKGQSKVSVKGVNGTRSVVYTVSYTSGKETKRVIKSDKVTKAPVDEVTLVGTHVAPPAEIPSEPTESPSKDGFTQSDRTVLQDIKRLLEELKTWLQSVFNK